MIEPHVEALIYRVGHDATVNYDRAKPLEHDAAEFVVRIEDGIATFTMKSHCATSEAARAIVEPFIRAWELSVCLDIAPGQFGMNYQDAKIIDRNPPPGKVLVAGTGRYLVTGMDAVLQVGRATYPAPPASPMTVSPDVAAMAYRYAMYRQGKDTFGAMAYFCLTVLTARQTAATTAKTYSISKPILVTFAEVDEHQGRTRRAQGRRCQSGLHAC